MDFSFFYYTNPNNTRDISYYIENRALNFWLTEA